MALSASKTGKKIAAIITDSGASPEMKEKIAKMWTDVMSVIYSDIMSDAQITVAAGIACQVAPPNYTGATTSPGTATIA